MDFHTLLKNNNNYYFRIEYLILVNRNEGPPEITHRALKIAANYSPRMKIVINFFFFGHSQKQ